MPGRWNASVRSTREWKDGQTDSEVSRLHQTTNLFEQFFFANTLVAQLLKKKKKLEFLYIVHSPTTALVLNLEKFKICIKISIKLVGK